MARGLKAGSWVMDGSGGRWRTERSDWTSVVVKTRLTDDGI